jgi:CheY-like chemotaxis protein
MREPKPRILIVDDKACVRTTMSLVLVELGYEVRAAEDGFAALREIRTEIPDVLISDLNMPGMSGFELLSVVRRRFPAILVIAMSGSFSGREVPSGVSADAFYQKGSSTSALIQILRTPPTIHRHLLPASKPVLPFLADWSGTDISGNAEISIICPDCLKSFSQARDDNPKRQAVCDYCGNSIEYVALEQQRWMNPQPERQRGGIAFAAPGAANSGD